MTHKEAIEAFRPFLQGELAFLQLVAYHVRPGATVYPDLLKFRDLANKVYAELDSKKPVVKPEETKV